MMLASGPFVEPGNGFSPRRIVMIYERGEYVVFKQSVQENGKYERGNGHYFPVRNDDRSIVFKKAFDRFVELMQEETKHYPSIDPDNLPARFKLMGDIV